MAEVVSWPREMSDVEVLARLREMAAFERFRAERIGSSRRQLIAGLGEEALANAEALDRAAAAVGRKDGGGG